MQLFFEGLCAFALREHHWSVFLPAGHHHPHRPVLTIRANQIDLDMCTWLPDGFVLNPFAKLGHQYFGFWDLLERSISVGSDKTVPVWYPPEHLQALINLKDHTPGDPATIPQGKTGLVKLHGGQLSEVLEDGRCLLLAHPNGSGVEPVRDYAARIVWTGPAVEIKEHSLDRRIILKEPDTVMATIVNVTADGRGDLAHFHNYYDLLPDVLPQDQLNLIEPIGRTDCLKTPGVSPKLVNPFEGVNCIPPGHVS